MSELDPLIHGIATRLKKKQRGFHFDPSPGFYGVKKLFGKTAEACARGVASVLAKYALLDNQKTPIEDLAKLFSTSNFGYGDNPGKRPGKEPVNWGAAGPAPDGQGDRAGASRFLRSTSV